MSRLRVGGPVPCKRPRPNPETITGYPQINTFQGLGMPSTVKQIKLDARAAGVRLGGGGGRATKRLDPRNLCHRVHDGSREHFEAGQRRHYEEARRLSLLLDRLDPENPAFDLASTRWEEHMRELIFHRSDTHLRNLFRMERARGQMRTQLRLSRANMHWICLNH